MAAFLIIVIALVESAIFVGLMYAILAKRKHDLRAIVEGLQSQLADKQQALDRVKGILADMIDIKELKAKGRDLKLLKESLKTERGRITITQAELETVEGRLRELEEIDRELEASGLETKEEIIIIRER